MKLARKFILIMVAGMTLVLSANSYYRVHRELDAFDKDMHQDHEILAAVLRRAVPATWTAKGRDAALAVIDEVKSPGGGVRVRWFDVDKTSSRKMVDDALVTDVPILVDGKLQATLEIRESHQFAHDYVRTTLIRSFLLTLAAVACSAAIATVLGLWFVGKPIEKLVDKARRIGAGDVSGQLAIRQHDEIGELAAEINAMCLRLAETRYALDAETKERLRAQEQLRHADRLATVGKLASGIAHELGTPLGVALMRANMIAGNEHVGREVKEGARIISEQMDRITGIVRQLLDFARGRGAMPPGTLRRSTPSDLVAIAQRAITMLQPLAVKRGLDFELVFEKDPPQPPAHAQQIEQVLVNLLVNAVHASDKPGKITIRIALADARPPADVTPPVWTERQEPAYAVLSVQDEGVGIAPDVLPRIFEPFFTTKHVGEGTGLGLSVAYGIVREHGGWIEVESERNRGSLFTVYLPMDFAELV
jgi:two-component system NtrC family sensor kinase